jgi:hypothetical protein
MLRLLSSSDVEILEDEIIPPYKLETHINSLTTIHVKDHVDDCIKIRNQ